MTNAGYILIVDSDDYITELLAVNLRDEGFDVGIYCNTSDVPAEIYPSTRLIIVDAMNQDLNGLDYTRALKADPTTQHIPVILCSMADGEDLIVDAFDAGVDDYIVKPFSLRELIARVRAVLRRHPMTTAAKVLAPTNSKIQFGSLLVDTSLRRVTTQTGETIPLTRTEFAILAVLLTHRNTYFTRADIRAEVWKDDTMTNDRIVDTNISRLRKKLGEEGELINNRYGMGYAITDKQ